MNNEVFMLDNARYVRVNRKRAKRAYIDGATVIVAPVKANMYFALTNFWYMFSRKELKARYGYTPHFDTFINEFEFYNCNN